MPLSREDISSEPVPGGEPPVRAGYEFEPSAEGILDLLLPRYVDSRCTRRCSTPRRPSTRPGSGR